MCLILARKLSLFFLKLFLLDGVPVRLEVGEEDVDLGKTGLLGVVGVSSLIGGGGGLWAGFTRASGIPLVVPLGCPPGFPPIIEERGFEGDVGFITGRWWVERS